jgi:CDP-6-deoxy-D-xylo-4-hexulose-3-dehydrase
VSDGEESSLRQRVLEAAVAYYEQVHGAKQPFAPGSRIPYGGRVFDQEELCELVGASLDFWLTAGRYTRAFETGLAAFVGVKHAALVNSGSSANLLAIAALTSPALGTRRIGPGDEVITVAAGFPTTVAPIIQHGAVPVFVDISLPTFNIDVAELRAALSPRTRAVMVAHTLGNPFDLGAVMALCEENDLWLIEDNCDALGAGYLYRGDWRRTGSVGHLATSSFYPPHHMTMGEGGAVYTNDATLERLVESFRDWGRDCWCPSGRDNTCNRRFGQQHGELPPGYDHKYVYSHFGYNLKATEMQAAVGCAQLRKLPAFIAARRRNWQRLRDGLDGLRGALAFAEPTAGSDPSWFGFLITVEREAGFSRNELAGRLERDGIQTRMLFAGNITRQPCFDELRRAGSGYRVVGDLAVTDRVMSDTLWLGVYPGLTEEMLDHVVDATRRAVDTRCR